MLLLEKFGCQICQLVATAVLVGSSVNAGWASDAETLKPCTRQSTWQEREDSHSSEPSGTSPAKKHRTSAAVSFCPALFAQDFVADQKAIWTSPFHLHIQDKKWLLPLGVGTLGLVASDQNIMRHFGNSPMAHSSSFSNYGLAAMVGGAATLYLRGTITQDDHSRETGFLAGEAAVNSVIVGEAMKLVFQRPRPNEAHAGSFGAGGTSFPSEHALLAWSIASVIAHEYPGPLTKLLAYGAATGVSDAVDVLKAILTGSFAFLVIVRYGLGLKVFPLSIYALEALITFTLLTAVRVLSRLLAETVRADSTSKRLLLVGAGHAAQMIIRSKKVCEFWACRCLAPSRL